MHATRHSATMGARWRPGNRKAQALGASRPARPQQCDKFVLDAPLAPHPRARAPTTTPSPTTHSPQACINCKGSASCLGCVASAEQWCVHAHTHTPRSQATPELCAEQGRICTRAQACTHLGLRCAQLHCCVPARGRVHAHVYTHTCRSHERCALSAPCGAQLSECRTRTSTTRHACRQWSALLQVRTHAEAPTRATHNARLRAHTAPRHPRPRQLASACVCVRHTHANTHTHTRTRLRAARIAGRHHWMGSRASSSCAATGAAQPAGACLSRAMLRCCLLQQIQGPA
jgi:hypothetical protein